MEIAADADIDSQTHLRLFDKFWQSRKELVFNEEEEERQIGERAARRRVKAIPAMMIKSLPTSKATC